MPRRSATVVRSDGTEACGVRAMALTRCVPDGEGMAALPIVAAFIETRGTTTVRLGEAWFLKGKLEAGALKREEATASLKKFLRY